MQALNHASITHHPRLARRRPHKCAVLFFLTSVGFVSSLSYFREEHDHQRQRDSVQRQVSARVRVPGPDALTGAVNLLCCLVSHSALSCRHSQCGRPSSASSMQACGTHGARGRGGGGAERVARWRWKCPHSSRPSTSDYVVHRDYGWTPRAPPAAAERAEGRRHVDAREGAEAEVQGWDARRAAHKQGRHQALQAQGEVGEFGRSAGGCVARRGRTAKQRRRRT